MADTKISALTEQTVVTPATLLTTVDGGVNKRLTVANLQAGIVTGSASITTQELTVEQYITFEVQGSLPSGNGKGKNAVGSTGDLYYVNPSGTVYLLNIHALSMYDDGVFKASGSSLDFGRNLNVSVTGSSVFVRTSDALIMPELTGTSQPESGYSSLFVKDDGAYLLNGASGSLLGPHGGWIPVSENLIFSSADAPSYVLYTNEDVTGKYSPGMRLKFNQASTMYGIITKIANVSGTHSLMTFYGGTDYSATGTSITSTYYSREKAPVGFPLDSTKWTVQITDTTLRSQASPTQNTWYNLGAVSISLPIGMWKVSYSGQGGAQINGIAVDFVMTLSTGNNSESDSDFTTSFYKKGGTSTDFRLYASAFIEKNLNVAAKTVYYFNTRTVSASVANIFNINSATPLRLRAESIYI